MISCILNGGLGNQMSQISTTWVLARDHNDDCGFNFSMVPVHQGNNAMSYRSNIFKKLKDLPNGWKPLVVYKEPAYEYKRIPYYNRILLKGYFAGERYIGHRKNEVIELFKDKQIVDTLSNIYKDKLIDSVSIHVRRGDYLKFNKVYVLLDSDYYKRAMEIIESRVNIKNILVFSDDIRWCEQNMHDKRMSFIKGHPDYYDIYLMSLCSHNITANSSFSWWGSYLNSNPDKIVCTPGKWFLSEGPKNSDYLICENWIKI